MKKIQQFNIMAFEYERLARAGFEVEQGLDEAEANEELIALADNECLRAIRRVTKHRFEDGGASRLTFLFSLRKKIMRAENSEENRKALRDIHAEVRELLYVPEYVCVTFPQRMKKRDYENFNKNGFYINGVKYKWLLCGASHQRTNRAFYCTVEIYDKLYEVLLCGARNVPIMLPKFNAYLALSSSASFVVSTPRVCVVDDCEINMVKTIDWVDELGEDNYSVERMDKELGFNLFDGMGIISPEFAKIWAEELELDYLPSCWGIRTAFIKGMVCVFDFHKFSKEVANRHIIKDLWGNDVDTDNVDMIITKSQFKLWNAYDSWQDYLSFHCKYKWSWATPRVSPKRDTDWVTANYQYLQVLDLSDDDISELCKETVDWFYGVASDKNIEFKKLYLLGKIAKSEDVEDIWNRTQDNTIKALMLDGDLINDKHINEKICRSIKKKMTETYIGKIIIRGNYQTRVSDPYALCEWIYGMEVKGLLKDGEAFIDYWNKLGKDRVVAMRSPLTWKSEAHELRLVNNEETKKWYSYINSGIIYSVWGCDCMLEADGDYDLDASCTTDNEIFLKGIIK